MADLDNLERRMDQIERKLDEVLNRAPTDELDAALKRRAAREVSADTEPARPRHNRTGRIFLGIFILAIGSVWLGETMGWLPEEIKWWPIALIAFGAYLIFGRRDW